MGALRFHWPSDRVREVKLSELLEGASAAAERVLRAASVLGGRRVRAVADAGARLAAVEREPWALPRRRPLATPLAITQSDLVQALVACEPEAVAATFLGTAPPARLVEASAQIQAGLEEGGEPLDVLLRPLGLRWYGARGWGLSSVELKHVLGAVDEDGQRAIARFDDRVTEGLITDDEAYHRSLDALNGVWRWPAVPLIVADRDDAIARIGKALDAHALVMVLSPSAHCGRRTRIEQLLSERPDFMIGHAWFYLGSEAQNPLFDSAGLSRDALVWTFATGNAEPHGGRGELGRASADDLDEDLRLSREHPNRRTLLSVTESESAVLLAHLPRLAQCLRVELPARTDRDLLPRWLSLGLSITDDEGLPVPIAELVATFEASTDEEKSTVDRDTIRRALHKHRPSDTAVIWRRRFRAIHGGRLRLSHPFVDRYIGSRDDLLTLATLATTLDP
jgi:hypothetical protein